MKLAKAAAGLLRPRLDGERRYHERRYEQIFGRTPNLDLPTRFTEKLIWLNLHYRDPWQPILTDKYLMRSHVANVVGGQYLVPLLGVWDRPDEVDFLALPDKFVLKATGGFAQNLFCTDKSTFDISAARQTMAQWTQSRHYENFREWPYRDVRSRLIAEPFLADDGHAERSSPDFKFWCFHGEPKFISVCYDRRGETKLEYVDRNWVRTPFRAGSPPACDVLPERPTEFDQMLAVAGELAVDFPFVRVDLYQHRGQILVGELTWYPFAGYIPINPVDADEMIGQWLDLSRVDLHPRRTPLRSRGIARARAA